MSSHSRPDHPAEGRSGSGRTVMTDPELSAFYEEVFLPLVRRATWRYGLSKEDARDVVQDSFLVAIEKIDSTRNPRAWLIQVVDHLALNHQRKMQRRARLWRNGSAHAEMSSRQHAGVETWRTGDVTSSLSAAMIRSWVATPETHCVSTGLSSLHALDHALRLWKALTERDDDDLAGLGPDLPDVLHALVILLQNGLGDSAARGPHAIRRVQELIESTPICSRTMANAPSSIEVRLSLLAFESSTGSYEGARQMGGALRCSVGPQGDAEAFLRLAPSDRTEGLDDRFFSEPTVVLALCRALNADKNREPARVAREAEATHRWLSTHDSLPGADDRAFFCGIGALAWSRSEARREIWRGEGIG